MIVEIHERLINILEKQQDVKYLLIMKKKKEAKEYEKIQSNDKMADSSSKIKSRLNKIEIMQSSRTKREEQKEQISIMRESQYA